MASVCSDSRGEACHAVTRVHSVAVLGSFVAWLTSLAGVALLQSQPLVCCRSARGCISIAGQSVNISRNIAVYIHNCLQLEKSQTGPLLTSRSFDKDGKGLG